MIQSLLRLSLCAAALTLASPAVSRAGVANRGLRDASSNPLAGMAWGAYHPPSLNPGIDAPSAYYNAGVDRALMSKIVFTPRFRWFGGWIPLTTQGYTHGVFDSTKTYIGQVTGGNPGVGVQIATFRMDPWEGQLKKRLPSEAEKSAYRLWIARMATAIGDKTRVAMVVQPDGPLAPNAKGGSSWPYPLLSHTIRTFSALAHTTVYMDAGSGDWQSAADEARILEREGVRGARGFSLNLTHYDSTRGEVKYAKELVKALAARGIRNKHAIINTAQNGRPWTYQQDAAAFYKGAVCASRKQRHCVAFGPRPTTKTGTSAVDAFLWIGRPWVNNATRRSAGEIANLVRYSPFLTR